MEKLDLFDLIDSDFIDNTELLIAVVKWLDSYTNEAIASDIIKDYDLDIKEL